MWLAADTSNDGPWADRAHLIDLAKLRIAGNIRGDRCKSY